MAEREAKRRRALRHPARALDAIFAVTGPNRALERLWVGDVGRSYCCINRFNTTGTRDFVGQLFPSTALGLGLQAPGEDADWRASSGSACYRVQAAK